jgi:hypothetical protein
MCLFEGLNGGWYYGFYFLSRIFDSYGTKDGNERDFEKNIEITKKVVWF